MVRTLHARRLMLFLIPAVLAGTMGQTCNFGGPPFNPAPVVPVVTTVTVELVNQTGDDVDPGLFVDGAVFGISPPLAPGEVATVDFDCATTTTFQTDATLLALVPIASDSVPIAEEGIEYVCGDTISFIFAIDQTGTFFTRLEVNGVFVAD